MMNILRPILLGRPCSGSLGVLLVMLCTSVAWADASNEKEPLESKVAEMTPVQADIPSPWHGSLTLDQSLGLGTFSEGGGDLSRPYYNVLVSLRGHYDVPVSLKLSVGLRIDVDVNVVENMDSSNTRPHQVHLGDIRLWVHLKELLNDRGSGLSLSGGLNVLLPTSLLSQFATKWLGLRVGATLLWNKLEWLSLSYSLSGTKNFNGYTTAALDWSDFNTPRLSRPGGAENIAQGLTATGAGVVEWGVSNTLSASATFLKEFSFSIAFALINTFTYDIGPPDIYTSPYAQSGRAQRDLTYGSIDFAWSPTNYLTLSLGSVVTQEPKTGDNTGFRFPFWDLTNGASNRQVLYLSLKGSI